MAGIAAGIVLILAGAVIAASAGGRFALNVAGLTVAGVGAVVAVSATFWIIGRSEDRDRERD
jgi:hypothetical protein